MRNVMLMDCILVRIGKMMWPLLCAVAACGNEEIFMYLLREGADPNMLSTEG